MSPIQRNIILFFAHRFLTSFTLGLYFIFGVLLIYHKTESILLTLLFNLVNYLGIILFNTLFLKALIQIINYVGQSTAMVTGLVALSMSYMLLFWIPVTIPHFVALLFIIAILNSLGSNLYYILSDTLYFALIGNSKNPSAFSAMLSTNSVMAGLTVSILGLVLSYQEMTRYLFVVASISLIAAAIILFFIKLTPSRYNISFPAYLNRLSLFAHISSMELTHELSNTALPLVIVLLFHSINKSFWITGLASIGMIVGVNLVGYFKNKGSNLLVYVSAFGALSGWILYLFIHTPVAFIVAGVLTGVSYKIINSVFESRMGREMANSESNLEANLAFNFSKIFGRVLVVVILLGTYLVTRDISKIILVLGSVFLLPKIIYSLRHIDALQGHNRFRL